jgi:hypothetical protein
MLDDLDAPGAVADVFGQAEGAVVDGLGHVEGQVHVEAHHLAHAVALRAHAGRVVEREQVGAADVRLAKAAKHEAQGGGDVGDGADGGMRAAAEGLLVDDDGHAQVFDFVGFGLRDARQEVAHEHAEVFVQQALGFGRDGVEHQRRFARAGHAGKDGDLALGDFEARRP